MIHTLAYLWNSPWYNTFSSNIFVTIFLLQVSSCKDTEKHLGFDAWHEWIVFFCWSWQEDFGVKEKDEDTEHCMVPRSIEFKSKWIVGTLYFHVFSLYDYMWFSEKILPLSNASQIISLHGLRTVLNLWYLLETPGNRDSVLCFYS